MPRKTSIGDDEDDGVVVNGGGNDDYRTASKKKNRPMTLWEIGELSSGSKCSDNEKEGQEGHISDFF